MKRVCVFCGSRLGADETYAAAAAGLGRELVRRGLDIVYGGGSIGLMGRLADAALEAGGRVIGVIPDRLARTESLHARLTQAHVVSSMHERKALMSSLADAFIALPGGFGTFEELFEIITWAQLGIQRKPIGVLDVAGYFRPLIDLVDRGIDTGFIRKKYRDLFFVDADPASLITRLAERWVEGEPPREVDLDTT
jgi:uncharacterized protein (TIGR00730 family)